MSFVRSYLLALGEFNLDDEGVLSDNYFYFNAGWIIFVFATLFNMIIMMNLLIALMGGS